MIARVRFLLKGEPAEAVLGDDGRWACDDAAVRDTLDALAAAEDRSPADGLPLRGHARRVAGLLGGTAEFPPADPGPPGRLY